MSTENSENSEYTEENTERIESKRYKENPFLADMVLPIKDKRITLRPLGKSDRVINIDQSTGEVLGTHLTTYKRVDGEQFVKLFTANIALTFELKPPGFKALSVLVWVVQHKAISRDEVELDKYMLDDFLAANQLKLSRPTFMRGLLELEEAQIIAKTLRRGRYFINPNLIFNGDRIAFTTLIERKREQEETQQAQLTN